MKKIFHILLIIIFICLNSSLYGMKRNQPDANTTQELCLSDEVIVPIAAYSEPREKNTLMKVCKQFNSVLKNGRNQIIYANPWTIYYKDRETALFDAVCTDGAYPGGIRSDAYDLVERLLNTKSMYVYFMYNMLDKTPLHYAIDKNNKDMETLLIKSLDCNMENEINEKPENTHWIKQHYSDYIKTPKPELNPLFEAVYKGDIKQVKSLIESGTNPNITFTNNDKDEITSLHIAVDRNHIEIATLLLEYEANVDGIDVDQEEKNENQATPLHIAVGNNNIKMATLLIKYGAHINLCNEIDSDTPLDMAAKQDNADMVKCLLCADGIDIDCQRPLIDIIEQGLSETMKCLLCVDKIKAEWDYSNNVETDKALYYALSKDEAFYKSMDNLTDNEKNLKIIALVKALLDTGAMIEEKNVINYSSLYIAVDNDHDHKIIQLLLDKGATINQKDTLSDRTALHCAAENGTIETVKLLLTYGADPDIKNKFGETACSLAQDNGHSEVVSLLTDHNQSCFDV
ncbi:MAG TPA: ankyrin repeat domain-containing protein [Candidatus Babeliales bacterium]|nr:ankyrin repeat domain-containing protein [Candidatus Babeliales bacterium]